LIVKQLHSFEIKKTTVILLFFSCSWLYRCTTTQSESRKAVQVHVFLLPYSLLVISLSDARATVSIEPFVELEKLFSGTYSNEGPTASPIRRNGLEELFTGHPVRDAQWRMFSTIPEGDDNPLTWRFPSSCDGFVGMPELTCPYSVVRGL
jgi:hypothetical protein